MEYNPYYLSSPLDHASASLQADAAPTEGMKEEGSPTDINEAPHSHTLLCSLLLRVDELCHVYVYAYLYIYI